MKDSANFKNPQSPSSFQVAYYKGLAENLKLRRHIYHLEAMLVEMMTETVSRTVLDDLVIDLDPSITWETTVSEKAEIIKREAPELYSKIAKNDDDLSDFISHVYGYGNMKAHNFRHCDAVLVLKKTQNFPLAHQLRSDYIARLLTILVEHRGFASWNRAYMESKDLISGQREDGPTPDESIFQKATQVIRKLSSYNLREKAKAKAEAMKKPWRSVPDLNIIVNED